MICECGKQYTSPPKRLFCSCGLLYVDGVLAGIAGSKGRIVRNCQPLIPYWEQERRREACEACDKYKVQRCTLIDLGCRTTYLQYLHGRDKACPLGRWEFYPVRWVWTRELVDGAFAMCGDIPSTVTSVVAIPRSGMIPAAAIATHLHLPLFTVADGQVVPVGAGNRMDWGAAPVSPGRRLFVDDTVHDGGTIARLRDCGVITDHDIVAAVFVKNVAAVDVSYQSLPSPHLLEWNLLNTPWANRICTDFDGIVCHNPPRQPVPLYVPRRGPVRAIVSARRECDRDVAEDWLSRYGAKYDHLILWDGTDEDRWDVAKVASWKADVVKQYSDIELYIESEPAIADAMRACGVRVLCPAQGYLA